jgi:hypothetical protein
VAGKARPLEEEGGWLSPPRAAMVAKNVGVSTSVVWCGVVEVCECWVRDIIDKKRGRLPLGHASSSTNCSASLLPPAAPRRGVRSVGSSDDKEFQLEDVFRPSERAHWIFLALVAMPRAWPFFVRGGYSSIDASISMQFRLNHARVDKTERTN